jgi:succinyl-diaminopimelate desuccinylase
MRIDPIELSRELIAFNTINPPGNELSCIRHLEAILNGAELETSIQTFAPDRDCKDRVGSKPPLCLTAVSIRSCLETRPGVFDAFAGEIIDGKMYGRGSTDRKCGVAGRILPIGFASGRALLFPPISSW